GDNGSSGELNNSTFTIQYSTWAGVVWSTNNAQVEISTSGVNPTDSQSTSLSLDSNTTYYIRLWTNDEVPNYSSQSNLTSTVTLANSVSSPKIAQVFVTSVTLNWVDLPASPQSSSAEGYRLEASSTNFNGTGDIYSSVTTHVSLSTLTVSGLNGNTTYYFRVGSLNLINVPNYISANSTATLTYAPGLAATNFTSVQSSSINVQWTNGGNPAGTSYVIEISTDNFLTLLSSSTTTSLSTLFGTGGIGSPLDSNTTHHFRVKGLNHNNVEGETTVIGSTSTLAKTPTVETPSFTNVALSSITVQWRDDNNPSGTQYVVEISSDNFSTVLFSSSTQMLSTLFGTGGAGSPLDPNTTHYFRVKAVNHNNLSTSFTTLGSTSTWANVASSPDFSNIYLSSITVEWNIPTGGTEGYILEASSTNFNGSGTVHSSQTLNGQITQLTVLSPILDPNTTYYFRLGSFNWNQVNNFTNFGATSTLANVPVSTNIVTVYVSSVTVNWSEPTGSAEGYRLDASTASDFSGTILSSETNSNVVTTLTVEGLTSETTYYFRVGSFNWNTTLNFVNAGSTETLTLEDELAPDVVGDLVASTRTATSLLLTWLAPDDANTRPLNGNYAIQYSTWDGVTWSTNNAQILISTSGVNADNAQFRIVESLDPNTSYYFKLWTSDLRPNWSVPSNMPVEMTLSNEPSNLSLVTVSSDTMILTWDALPVSPSSETATGYQLEASSTNFDGSGVIRSSVTNSVSLNTLTVFNLDPNTTHYLRVGSLNEKGSPIFGTILSTASLAKLINPLASDFLTVYVGSVTTQWAAFPPTPILDSSEGYLLEASSTNFDGSGIIRSSKTTNVLVSTLTVPNLLPNTTYFFRPSGRAAPLKC
ncbi:hypothetical protein BVX98_00070, partial [bacterium F11]